MSEEELPTTLLNILRSLQRTRELDRIEQVLKRCSKRKGIKGVVLRKDLLTKIRQCDVELSNVLQAFQVELGLDIRFALIVQRREPIEATPRILTESNELIVRGGHFGTSLDQSDVITLGLSVACQTGWRCTPILKMLRAKAINDGSSRLPIRRDAVFSNDTARF
ncbi:hypothetical protein H4582DRAFT_2059957 [Lactarius indigo]|nr:hypothetical protein H4582DRAFT_2059957 [Lactarius indigo]